MAEESKSGPLRGKRFPFINLEKALERARALYEADRGGRPMPLMVVFEVWEYSDKSSGGYQTVGALKGYGLIEGSSAKLNLTSNALRYFRDERDEAKLALRKTFALRPKLIGELWSVWGDTPPADNVARSYLKIDLGLGDQQARALLGIYKDNLVFAELKSNDKVAEQEAETDEDDSEVELAGTRMDNLPPADRRPPLKGGVKQDVFTLDEGEVVFQWPERISKESFEDLESWMEIQLRKIKRRSIINDL